MSEHVQAPARAGRTAPAAPGRPPASPLAAVHGAAGNLAVADLLSPEAERRADAFAAAHPHPGDAGELRPLDPPAGERGLATRPLPRADRDLLEPGLGHDLGRVRIATGPDAARAAAAEGARAYANGGTIVFGAGERERGGARLLAHELAHVVQQAHAGRAAVQRQAAPDAGVAAPAAQRRRSFPIPRYEFGGQKQKPTEEATAGRVDLAYDGTTFTCTFFLDWRFKDPPGGWLAREGGRNLGDPAERERYKADFVRVVKESWEAKAPAFVEFRDGSPTGARAKLSLDLVDSGAGGARQPAGASDYTRVEVVPSTRAHVQYGDILLDASSLDPHEMDLSRYRDEFDYSDYSNLDVPIRVRTGKGPVSQVTAVHEFGHVLGLADEYVLPKGDVAELRTHPSVDVEEALRKRSTVTRRAMNVGSELTPDYFVVFARWLEALTGSQWYAEGTEPKARAKKPGKEQR